MNARTRAGTILSATTAALLVMSTPALAAGPGGGGGGGGGGAGGGGDSTTGALYSDLVIALRDVNGTPILKRYEVPATEETEATTEYCVQPVSYEAVPGVTASTNPVDGREVWVLPLQGEWIGEPLETLPVEEIEACDPWPQYAMFVSEVEMERLNLARTADEVIARKIADVALKLEFADAISLESTGRISYDGSTIDASPENAGMYQSLMKTGTIPGLPTSPTTIPGPPAEIGPDGVYSRFDAWELAAMTIGAAASKSTPLTIDAVEYYNRIIGFPPDGYTPPTAWPITFNRSIDPSTDAEMTTGEQFVDYSGFTYNRSETFKGSVTWLDVAALKWKVSKITDVVPFTNLTNLPSYDKIGSETLSGVMAFAQMADDVRALCNFIPDNTFLPGFYMDVPGVDTTAAQEAAITRPAVDLGTLPANVFATYPFQITASLLNPWDGTLIDSAQLRVTIDASDPLVSGDVVATSGGEAIPFVVNTDGDLVGPWGPPAGFPVAPGYNVSTTFDVTVAGTAPIGAYTVTLELIDVDAPEAVLASETGKITVNANVATVMWGDSVPKLATQGVYMTIPLKVYSPTAGTGDLALAITSPEALIAGDVKIYASTGDAMVAMPLVPNTAGALEGTWTAALIAGYNSVIWYATVAEGAPVGNYTFDVSLSEGNSLADLEDALIVAIAAPDAHGEQPPDAGEDTTAPTVTITTADITLTTATFVLTPSESDVTFECKLSTNDVAGTWESCSASKTYADLQPGIYTFSARATDAAGNVGEVEVYALVIPAAAPSDTQTDVTVPPTNSGSTGAAASTPPAAGAPAAGAPAAAPSATTPVVPTAVVTAKATNNRTKLFVNVNPNKGTGYWRIKVYRKVVKGDKVTWEKVGKTLRTKTSKETRTINLGKGTYRVKVMAKYGMQGAISEQVTLVR